MDTDRFERLLDRMERSGVASRDQLVGCTDAGIGALESRYEVRLPQAYKHYLEIMGHESWRLFRCDHIAASYRHVLDMTADQRRTWAESYDDDDPTAFELPPNGLLIAGRLGEQFEFIRCDGQDDSPISYFNEWEWEERQQHPSVVAWLESWCTQAEEAIASGYFDRSFGTTP